MRNPMIHAVFTTYFSRDNVCGLLHSLYCEGIIPHQPEILNSDTVRVNADDTPEGRRAIEHAVRVVRGAFGFTATVTLEE